MGQKIRKVWCRKLTPKQGAMYKSHKACPFELGWRNPLTGKVEREYKQTQDEALARQQEVFAMINEGMPVHGQTIELKVAIDLWIKSVTIKDRTAVEYKRTLETFGELCSWPNSNKWTITTIRKFIKARLAQEVTEQTVNKDLRQLTAFFAWAKEGHYIIKSPIEQMPKNARRLRTPKKRKVVYSPQQFQAVLAVAPSLRWKLYLLLLVNGIGRSDDLIKLKMDQIDLEQGKILMNLGKGAGYERAAPLHPSAIKVLKAYIKENEPKKYLFIPTRKSFGEKPTRNMFKQKIWEGICKEAKVPYIKMHSLRGCVATWLASRHQSATAAMAVLGHRSLQTTLAWYTALQDDELLESAVKRLPL